jgi:hypothetical protein
MLLCAYGGHDDAYALTVFHKFSASPLVDARSPEADLTTTNGLINNNCSWYL